MLVKSKFKKVWFNGYYCPIDKCHRLKPNKFIRYIKETFNNSIHQKATQIRKMVSYWYINFNHIHHQYSLPKLSPFGIIGWINWVWNQEISILLTIFVLPKTRAILLSSGFAVGYLYICWEGKIDLKHKQIQTKRSFRSSCSV